MTSDFTGYENLAKALRACTMYGDCPAWCPRYKPNKNGCISQLKTDAALAIENLAETVKLLSEEGGGA